MERRIRGLPAAGNDPMAAVCQYVLAPALGGFTLWLLYHSLKSGKQRLYFLARDGYLMSRAALLFCETLQLSRLSLRGPKLLALFPADSLLSSGSGGRPRCNLPGRNPRYARSDSRAGRAHRTRAEARRRGALPSVEGRGRDSLRQVTRGPPPSATVRALLLDAMNCHSRDAMPGLAGYLQQEGLLEEVPDAIVDSGWVGSMQMALNEVLASMGRTKPLEGYYSGLYALPPGADRGAYHCYDFAPNHGLTPKIFFNNCLFEAIFTAPHGMTTGYRRMGNNISRIMDSPMRTGMRLSIGWKA